MAKSLSNSAFWSSSHKSMFEGEQRGLRFSSANFFNESKSRPPSYFSRALGSPYLIVGNPWTPLASQSGFPSVVQSTSATSAEAESLKSPISLSQAGFIFLQWPHHGARNLMKTVLPATCSSQLAGVSSMDAARATIKAYNNMGEIDR